MARPTLAWAHVFVRATMASRSPSCVPRSQPTASKSPASRCSAHEPWPHQSPIDRPLRNSVHARSLCRRSFGGLDHDKFSITSDLALSASPAPRIRPGNYCTWILVVGMTKIPRVPTGWGLTPGSSARVGTTECPRLFVRHTVFCERQSTISGSPYIEYLRYVRLGEWVGSL